MNPVPSDVPAWVQIGASAVGLMIAVYVFISAQLKNVTPKNSPDLMVPSMTIADSASIRALVVELQNWAMSRRDERSDNQAIISELRDLNRSMDQLCDELRRGSRRS
jgi:hypothetical protein